jgi:Ca2+-binding RTX toxin-like protein
VLAVLLGASAAPSAATGATTTPAGTSAGQLFGCRASVARLSLGGTVVTEPAVANGATFPCATDSKLTGPINVLSGPLNIATVGPAGAFTYETGTLGDTPGVTALTAIDAISVPSIGLTVVGPIQAQASYECQGTNLVPSASSTLSVLKIGSQTISLSSLGVPGTLTIPGVATIKYDETIQTASSLTERVLDIDLLNSAVNLVVGEATVTAPDPSICTGNIPPTNTTTTVTTPGTTVTTPGKTVTSPGSTVTQTTTTPGSTTTITTVTPSNLTICAPGSSIDVSTGDCVIYGPNGQVIFVSLPFKGPTGGVVVTLAQALAKYHSPCLHGPGPQWVLIATKNGGRVTGTPFSDRILGLGSRERIAGLAGNDCIDGQGSDETVYDGNGNDREYVHAGRNRVGVGNGNDYVNGGSGSDWLTVGNGNDTVYGGKSSSRIDAGVGHDHISGGPSPNRIWVISAHVVISCGSSGHNRLFARRGPASYAAKHGCQRITYLK